MAGIQDGSWYHKRSSPKLIKVWVREIILTHLLRKIMSNQYLKPIITTPSSLVITAITQSSPMTVTVNIGNVSTESNTYIIGMAIRLRVPQTYLMYQANNLVGTIIGVIGNNLTLNIDSSKFDAFVVPFGNVEQPATISPNGSRNYEYNNNSGSVPFKSLNNQGN